MMKKVLNAVILLACLAAGFGIATAWKPMMKWWKGPGFDSYTATQVTGVGDAPANRGFTLAEPLADPAQTFGEWRKLWATAVGIQYTPAWKPGQIEATVKAAHAKGMIVTLLPPPVFSTTNPYPRPLAEIAAEAQAAKVDRLCVSWLETVPEEAYWTEQVTAVRAVFKGAVILASNDDIAPAVTCWHLSDYMGIAGRVTLPRRLPHASDVLTFHDMRLAWWSQLSSLESLARMNGKPVALLTLEVPLAVTMKLPLPEAKGEGAVPENPKLQAITYEALLAETKGRAKDTDMMLLMWGRAGNRDAANGVAGLLPKVAEAWDPKKPRQAETAPDQLSDADELQEGGDGVQ